MTLRFLLDTNTLSDAMGSTANDGVIERMRRYWESLATASVVYHELLYGARRMTSGAKRAAIEAFLSERVLPMLSVLPYDQDAAEWHAEERVRLTRLGTVPPFIDGQIAAIAAVNRLVLVTANQNDFRRFQGLRTENWRT